MAERSRHVDAQRLLLTRLACESVDGVPADAGNRIAQRRDKDRRGLLPGEMIQITQTASPNRRVGMVKRTP